VITEVGGGVYRVCLDTGETVDAALRGRLKLRRPSGQKVVIGDRVSLQRPMDHWVVQEVEHRRSQLLRRGPGGRRGRVMAANLDEILVVVSAVDPEPTLGLIDRLLVVAEASELPPVLVVNKVDLPGGDKSSSELVELYAGIGYPVLVVSAVSGLGLERFADRVCSGAAALVGPSGVGKSSLLNALDASLDLRVGEVSQRTRQGRHTTVSGRMIVLPCGGMVADTPGFGDVGLWGVEADQVGSCFPEIRMREGECQFRGCSHLAEPGCMVRDAVEAGEIAVSRWTSYRTLRSEA
jgi:ribosome biogenesis GTPase